MTDLEKFLDTYKQFGIELDIEDLGDHKIVKLKAGYCGFGGNYGCYSSLRFDVNGKFLWQYFMSN